eukprot:6948223-Pyramimonas_sp.AAC.1
MSDWSMHSVNSRCPGSACMPQSSSVRELSGGGPMNLITDFRLDGAGLVQLNLAVSVARLLGYLEKASTSSSDLSAGHPPSRGPA